MNNINTEKGIYKIIDGKIYGKDQWFKEGDMLEYIIIETEYDDCKFKHKYANIDYISMDGYIKLVKLGASRPIHVNVTNIYEMVKYEKDCECDNNENVEEGAPKKPEVKIEVITGIKYEESFVNNAELEVPNPTEDNERMVEKYSETILIGDIVNVEWECPFAKTINKEIGKAMSIRDGYLIIDSSKNFESKLFTIPLDKITKMRKLKEPTER